MQRLQRNVGDDNPAREATAIKREVLNLVVAGKHAGIVIVTREFWKAVLQIKQGEK